MKHLKSKICYDWMGTRNVISGVGEGKGICISLVVPHLIEISFCALKYCVSKTELDLCSCPKRLKPFSCVKAMLITNIRILTIFCQREYLLFNISKLFIGKSVFYMSTMHRIMLVYWRERNDFQNSGFFLW